MNVSLDPVNPANPTNVNPANLAKVGHGTRITVVKLTPSNTAVTLGNQRMQHQTFIAVLHKCMLKLEGSLTAAASTPSISP